MPEEWCEEMLLVPHRFVCSECGEWTQHTYAYVNLSCVHCTKGFASPTPDCDTDIPIIGQHSVPSCADIDSTHNDGGNDVTMSVEDEGTSEPGM